MNKTNTNTNRAEYRDRNFFASSLIFTQITSDGDDFLHKHHFYELFYIIQGEILHVFNNGEPMLLKSGDVCIIPPESQHIFLRDRKNTSSHRDILIHSNLLKECCSFISESTVTLFNNTNDCLISHLSYSQIEEMEKGMNNYVICRGQPDIPRLGLEKIICFDIIKLVLQNNVKLKNNYPMWLNSILCLFQDVSKLKQGLNAILESAYYSQPYICRTFKKFTGMTMTEYLLRERLIYAASLIQNTNMKITDIVYETGINSIPYFNKQFKLLFHVTPSQYRSRT